LLSTMLNDNSPFWKIYSQMLVERHIRLLLWHALEEKV